MGKASRHKQERHRRLASQDPGQKWMKQNPGGIKISPSLIELIEPYVDGETSLNELKIIVAAGALAWNLAIVPEPYRSEELEDLITLLDDEAAVLLYESLIPELVKRKLELFPEDPRLITGWDVRKKGGQPYITVAAVIDDHTRNSGQH